MTTVALKENLIKKISEIKDKKILQSISEFIDQDEIFAKNGSLILTPEMLEIIAISKDQIKNGQFKTNEQVMAEAGIWLGEKA
jgi:flagellar biosynthesis/type III secretory pathway protein FliH